MQLELIILKETAGWTPADIQREIGGRPTRPKPTYLDGSIPEALSEDIKTLTDAATTPIALPDDLQSWLSRELPELFKQSREAGHDSLRLILGPQHQLSAANYALQLSGDDIPWTLRLAKTLIPVELGVEQASPLRHRRIATTRARKSSKQLNLSLRAMGAEVLEYPCLNPLPLQPLAIIEQLREHSYGGLILSSPTGAELFAKEVLRLDFPKNYFLGVPIACIGQGTAEVLWAHGIPVSYLPEQAHSEGLSTCLEQHDQLKEHWLHIRGNIGRSILQDAFRLAGGKLDLYTAYRIQKASFDPSELKALFDEGRSQVDAILFSSGQSARNFVESCLEVWSEAQCHSLFEETKIVALGPVTASAINDLGFPVDAVAPSPNNRGFLEALLQLFDK